MHQGLNMMTDSKLAQAEDQLQRENKNEGYDYPGESKIIFQGSNFAYPVRGESILNAPNPNVNKNPPMGLDSILEDLKDDLEYKPLSLNNNVGRLSNSLNLSMKMENFPDNRIYLGGCLMNTKSKETWFIST